MTDLHTDERLNDAAVVKALQHRPVILFDGVCNLCNNSVDFILRHDRDERFLFATLQSDIAQELLKQYSCDLPKADSVVLLHDGKYFIFSDAALTIAGELARPWCYLKYLRLVPRCLRDAIYRWIGRNRYRFFGRSDYCRQPDIAKRSRFLDW